MNFKEKVQSMTAEQIILSMVEGLRNPKVKVDMGYYGTVRKEKSFFGLLDKEVCFGCAATNTICLISGVKFNKNNIVRQKLRAEALGMYQEEDIVFVRKFEWAIDSLRSGYINQYNEMAEIIGIAKIKKCLTLPGLTNNYSKKELMIYENLAHMQ